MAIVLGTILSSSVLGQIDWTIANPTLTGAAYGNGVYVLTEQMGSFWVGQDLTNWTRHPTPTSEALSAVAFGKGVFIAVGAAGLQTFALRSTNGVDWSQQVLIDGANPFYAGTMNVEFVNDKFVATGGFINVNGAFGGVLTSSDGITWKGAFVVPPDPGFTPGPAVFGAAYGNGNYIAVGGWQQPGPPYANLASIVTSTDGQNWNVTNGPTTGILNDAAFGGGVFVIVGGASMETQTNGIWQSGPAAGDLHSIVYGNGRFVAVGDGGAIRTSDDGFNWSNRTSGTSLNLSRVSLAQSGYVAVGDSGTILYSPDGAEWDLLQSSYIDRGIGGIAYGNGMFVASSATGSQNNPQTALRSSNGFGWASVQVRTNIGDLGPVAYGAGKFVVIGQEITTPAVLYTSSDAINWTTPQLPTSNGLSALGFANGLFLVGGINGPLMTSPDGETWTVRNNEDSAWAAFTYGNGVFLALASPTAVPGSVTVAISTDGLAWTSKTTTIDSVLWPPIQIGPSGLVFGRGNFVAASTSGRIFSSTDGVNWHDQNVPGVYTSLVYANGAFVAVGVGNLATSLDGNNWTQRPVTFTLVDWWDGPAFLTHGNNTFLTVCNGVGGAEVQTSPSVPFLQAGNFSPNRGFQMIASPGYLETFDLQASTDLQRWTTLTNFPKSAAEAPLVDSTAVTSPGRYYRIAAAGH